ncbi:MAG: hypothetical protein ACREHF_11745 [Rhizomicrobium sp.]
MAGKVDTFCHHSAYSPEPNKAALKEHQKKSNSLAVDVEPLFAREVDQHLDAEGRKIQMASWATATIV